MLLVGSVDAGESISAVAERLMRNLGSDGLPRPSLPRHVRLRGALHEGGSEAPDRAAAPAAEAEIAASPLARWSNGLVTCTGAIGAGFTPGETFLGRGSSGQARSRSAQ